MSNKFTKFECLEDRILIRPIKKEAEVTEAGIIDPNVRQKPTSEGEVIEVGEGRYATDTGVFMNTRLTKGDFILYPSAQGTPITIETDNGKEDVLLMRESDIILRISPANEKLDN